MITRYPNLCYHLLKNGVSYRELARITETSTIAIHLKMLGLKRWKLTEVLRICCFFRSPDAERMFRQRRVSFVR